MPKPVRWSSRVDKETRNDSNRDSPQKLQRSTPGLKKVGIHLGITFLRYLSTKYLKKNH